ncbi:LuxR family transcriptional regulator [Streptomyces sp. NPDC051976]|uniref:LuxR family transcriptional regulator n=1 Tax=Streptomyces sp. NPDC051976 TaxID=3154947 RepID=UPI003447474A
METAQSELVGRGRELSRIGAALDGAARGAGRVVVVRAGAGAGRTALLLETVRRARGAGFTVLTARGIASERELPFGLTGRLFAPVAPGAGADASDQAAQLMALHRELAALAARAPVLVAVDDVQLLDRESLRWLSALPGRVDHARIAVLLTLCPGEPCADPAVLDELLVDSAVELRPAALGAQEAAVLVERCLGAAPDPAFTAALLRVTGGSPLAVTELAAALRDAAVPPTADVTDVLDEIAVPRLAAAVHARLRRVSPHALAVARAVAVLGAEADPDRVAALCAATPAVVREVTAALDAAGVLVAPGARGAVALDAAGARDAAGLPAADTAVAFAQPLVRGAVLGQVPYAELQALRAEAARVLRETGAPEERVARQLMDLAAPAQPWAPATLRAAAATALTRGEPAAATAVLTRALDEPLALPERAAVLRELGHTAAHHDLPAAVAHLTAATRFPAPPEQQAGVVRELAEVLLTLGRRDEAAELLRGAGAPGGTAEAELWLGCAASGAAAADALAGSRRPDTKGGADEGRYLSLVALRTAWAGRSRSRAAAQAEQALGALPVTPATMASVLRAVLVLGQAGRVEDAVERCDALVKQAARWDHRPCLAAARSLRATLTHRLGRLPAAAEDARAALALLAGCGAPPGDGTAVEYLARLVDILVDAGEYTEAAALLARADLPGEIPATWAGTALLLARGRLRAAAGQPAEGVRDLLTAGGRLPSWTVDNPAVSAWRADAAAALLHLGETNEARRQAAETVELARQWGTPGPLGVALRALGRALGGSEGLAALEKSVSVLERSPARLELARSLTEYGVALGRAKRAVPARRALRAALELAQSCGCEEPARRARIELSASGGRPPKSVPGAEGVAALTAAELRTATLAAEGRTNRELAEHLLVGLRTVEVHLTNAYRKLGIDGREQLPGVLRGG